MKFPPPNFVDYTAGRRDATDGRPSSQNHLSSSFTGQPREEEEEECARKKERGKYNAGGFRFKIPCLGTKERVGKRSSFSILFLVDAEFLMRQQRLWDGIA